MKKRLNIEEIRALQIELLDKIMAFCKEKKLRCWLCGGSLIGAVRHNGFIPWDDDIDVEMPRKDYMEFLKTFPQDEKFKIYSPFNSPNCYYTYAKVYNNETIVVENIAAETVLGLNVDLFPLDNLPSDMRKIERLYRKIKFLQNLLWVKLIKVNNSRAVWKNLFLILAKMVMCPCSKEALVKKIDKMSQFYSSEGNGTYVAAMVVLTYGKKEIMKREWFASCDTGTFENKEYPIPIGWHQILTQMYGDYMTPPPENKRCSTHDFAAYLK